MKAKARKNLFYVLLIGGSLLFVYLLLQMGHTKLEGSREIIHPGHSRNPWQMIVETYHENIIHPLAILLLQIVVIILAARMFSWLFRKIGQPAVIGEILAGIVLGPSLIGFYFPGFSEFLFPVDSLSNLHFLSQIGLILFMFVVGMELDLSVLRKQVGEVLVVSHASIVLPFILGILLSFFLYTAYADQQVSFLSFSLFMGISMSITAFPVLARIVQERGIHKTKLGTIVITCAAIDDITAWSLLAVIIAIVKAGSILSAIPTVVMAVLYVFLMLKFIRPFLKRIGDLHASRENLSRPVVSIFFLVLILSAWTTEVIGIHALFGAFMAGMIMPDNQRFKQIFTEKVEDVALVLLLPLFFIYTGLRTEIGLLDDPSMWLICLLIIFIAVFGKLVGSAIAARFIGQSWKDSLYIGALMNTRGLVELVALNIGYDLGVISPVIFAMLVIMALSTTFMTAPALSLIDWLFRNQKDDSFIQAERNFKVLVSFAKPEMGGTLLRIASQLRPSIPEITALHFSPSGLFSKYKLDQYEKDAFKPVDLESKRLNVPYQKVFRSSDDIPVSIADQANKGNFDLLLIGIGQSIYKGSMLGNILGYSNKLVNTDQLISLVAKGESSLALFPELTRAIIAKCKIPVGILIDNQLISIKKACFLSLAGPNQNLEYPIRFPESIQMDYVSVETVSQLPNSPDDIDLVVLNQQDWYQIVSENPTFLDKWPAVLILIPV